MGGDDSSALHDRGLVSLDIALVGIRRTVLECWMEYVSFTGEVSHQKAA